MLAVAGESVAVAAVVVAVAVGEDPVQVERLESMVAVVVAAVGLAWVPLCRLYLPNKLASMEFLVAQQDSLLGL